jgi:hypothetical protein
MYHKTKFAVLTQGEPHQNKLIFHHHQKTLMMTLFAKMLNLQNPHNPLPPLPLRAAWQQPLPALEKSLKNH